LSEEGNRFALAYYEPGTYFKDYESTLAKNLPSIYHVADNWENFDLLSKVIDLRYDSGSNVKQKPWWKLW
jgi:hypothetical protein